MVQMASWPCKYGHDDGRHADGKCRVCVNIRSKAAYWKNREARLAYGAARYQRVKALDPEKMRAKERLTKGFPEPTRPLPKICECCGQSPGVKAMNLDHCHKTGKFRGWLCSACNRGIGLLGDTVDGVQNALNYLHGALSDGKNG